MRRRAATSPLAEDIRGSLDAGTREAVAIGRRRAPVTHTTLPTNPRLVGADALETALTHVPTEPRARAYQRWLALGDTLHALRDADDAFVHELVAQAQHEMTGIALDLGAALKETTDAD